MKIYFFQTKILFPLALFIFFTSCNGQVNTNLSKESVGKPRVLPGGQSKLVKTQGSNPSDNVHCGLQDKSGSLWFGTTGEGVYRYDGKSFTQFTTKDGLNSNTVWSILEDTDGSIWIGTDAGLSRFDGTYFIRVPITVNFMPAINNANDGSVQNSVWSMLQDKSGKIWFGTSSGVYTYNGKSFTHFLQNDGIINKDSLQLKMVDDILEDKKGIIWFASGMPPGGEGVCRFDGKTITHYKPNGDGWIRYMIEDKKGHIWFGGRINGNFRYDGINFSNFMEKAGIGNAVLSDKSGNIWFTGEEGDTNYESRDGVWRYDGNSFTNFSTKDGMGTYFVHCMIEDSNGNIWIGTRNTGLYRYDGKTFTNFSE